MKILLSICAMAAMLWMTAGQAQAQVPGQVCDQFGCQSYHAGPQVYRGQGHYGQSSYRVDPWSRAYNMKPGYGPVYAYPGYGNSRYGYPSYAYRGYSYRRPSCSTYWYR